MLICPYRDKVETTVQKEIYCYSDDNPEQSTKTETILQTIHQPMECVKAECGAFYNGKCNYKN